MSRSHLPWLALLLFACSEEFEGQGSGPGPADIFGGSESGENQNFAVGLAHIGPEAARFPNNDIQTHCTGTVIAPRVVITARHCVQQDDGLVWGGDLVPQSELAVVEGTSLDQTFRLLPVLEVLTPTPAEVPTGSYVVHGDDFAALILSEDASVPALPVESDQQVHARGTSATIIGWGLTEDGAPRTRRTRIVEVLALGPLSGLMLWDYSPFGPPQVIANTGTDAGTDAGTGAGTDAGSGVMSTSRFSYADALMQNEILVSEGACFGDSGGPLVINGHLAGVASRLAFSGVSPEPLYACSDNLVIYGRPGSVPAFLERVLARGAALND